MITDEAKRACVSAIRRIYKLSEEEAQVIAGDLREVMIRISTESNMLIAISRDSNIILGDQQLQEGCGQALHKLIGRPLSQILPQWVVGQHENYVTRFFNDNEFQQSINLRAMGGRQVDMRTFGQGGRIVKVEIKIMIVVIQKIQFAIAELNPNSRPITGTPVVIHEKIETETDRDTTGDGNDDTVNRILRTTIFLGDNWKKAAFALLFAFGLAIAWFIYQAPALLQQLFELIENIFGKS